MTQTIKSVCNAGDPGSIPGSRRCLEKEIATHFSVAAWNIPWTVEPGRLQSMGSRRVGHNWATNTFTLPLFMHIFFSAPIRIWHLSSLTRDWTCAPCIGSQRSSNTYMTLITRKDSKYLRNRFSTLACFCWLSPLIACYDEGWKNDHGKEHGITIFHFSYNTKERHTDVRMEGEQTLKCIRQK